MRADSYEIITICFSFISRIITDVQVLVSDSYQNSIATDIPTKCSRRVFAGNGDISGVNRAILSIISAMVAEL